MLAQQAAGRCQLTAKTTSLKMTIPSVTPKRAMDRR